jgi:glutathione synthase/RimK-type ligase-like ATP-grasp enzyme
MDNSHTQVLNIENQRDVAEYSLVYFKSHVKSSEFAAALAEYLQFKGRPFLDREVKQYMSASKLSEYMKLVCYDLPVPPTICAKTTVLKKSYAKVAHQLGVPFVLKEIFSDRGRNNYLIDNEADYTKILEQAEPDHTYIAQKYVDNDGFMRLYVLGKEVQLAILRTSHPHKEPLKRHLNKPAGGLNARKLKLDTVPSEVHDIAARAAMSLNRQVVGVDMIQDKTSKKWYILEANSAPQIRSGSNVDEKAAMIAHYFDKELNR